MSTLPAIRESETSEIIQELLSLLGQEEHNSIPRVVLERELARHFSERMLKAAIQRAVDEYLVTIVTDYAAKKWDVYDGEVVWYVKTLSPDDARRLRELEPLDLALLRLLQQQNGPFGLGEMRCKEAEERILAQGFTEKEARHRYIPDITYIFRTTCDSWDMEHVALIPEYRKTPEYKAAKEESDRELEDITAFHMKVLDIEEEDMDKRARAKKKRKAS